MKTNIQIKTIFGSVIFEFEKENNSVKDALSEAYKRNVYLRGAYLQNANLRGAFFGGADLRYADLLYADLRGIHLYDACLRNANIRKANLDGADLQDTDSRCAIFWGANLRGANLNGADLRNSNFYHANLNSADLRNADLRNANLDGADLRNANLDGACFRNVDLCNANLDGANINGADIRGAFLSEAKNIPFVPTYLPDGEFIAWKKFPNGLLAKLKILEDSKRSRATGDKCRCDKCLVLEFQNKDGSKSDMTKYVNLDYELCVYKVGEIVSADAWDDNRWNECSNGIYFFIDRKSAVDY